MDNVKLRVYHRTQNDIVLLWSSEKLTEDQKGSVKILCEGKDLKFAQSVHTDDSKAGIPKNTVICVIEHEPNGLKPEAKYSLQIILGGVSGDPIMRKMLVLEYGILPQFEKDRKSARVHLMGWDYAANCWAKIPIIKTKRGYAIPMLELNKDELDS